MRRVVAVMAVVLLLAGCDGDSDDEAATTEPTATTETTAVETATSAAPGTGTSATTAAPAATTTTAGTVTAFSAIVEPDSVAGIPLGSNKSAAIAVLGQPTTTGQNTDLSGARYDFLRWGFGGGERGLTLNYRTPSVTSPLLTDWIATAPGPTTARGVSVGGFATAVMESYGPLQSFCCDSSIASVERGGGRLIVVVGNGSRRVEQIIGGDPAFWSRSIAD